MVTEPLVGSEGGVLCPPMWLCPFRRVVLLSALTSHFSWTKLHINNRNVPYAQTVPKYTNRIETNSHFQNKCCSKPVGFWGVPSYNQPFHSQHKPRVLTAPGKHTHLCHKAAAQAPRQMGRSPHLRDVSLDSTAKNAAERLAMGEGPKH